MAKPARNYNKIPEWGPLNVKAVTNKINYTTNIIN